MIDLKIHEIRKNDPKDVFGSTELFADQCQQMVDEHYEVDIFPLDYKNVKNVIICGMGGSAYGAHIVNALFHQTILLPLTLVSDYTLPGFVDEHSLVFLTSYSGTTEEVLSCENQAKKKNAKIAVLSSGGQLGEFVKKTSYPGLIFNPKHNPSGQPRLATGYIVLGTIVMLAQLEIIHVKKEQIKDAIQEVRNNKEQIKSNAKDIAEESMGYVPVIFASEFLNGNSHIIRNQLNETSKSFSAFSELPELNHHLLEGLKNPGDKKLIVLFLMSKLYSQNIQKRMTLTKEVVTRNNIKTISCEAFGSTQLSQMLNVLCVGGYYSLFLGLLYGQDPGVVPWVDYFKEKMKKS